MLNLGSHRGTERRARETLLAMDLVGVLSAAMQEGLLLPKLSIEAGRAVGEDARAFVADRSNLELLAFFGGVLVEGGGNFENTGRSRQL